MLSITTTTSFLNSIIMVVLRTSPKLDITFLKKFHNFFHSLSSEISRMSLDDDPPFLPSRRARRRRTFAVRKTYDECLWASSSVVVVSGNLWLFSHDCHNIIIRSHLLSTARKWSLATTYVNTLFYSPSLVMRDGTIMMKIYQQWVSLE